MKDLIGTKKQMSASMERLGPGRMITFLPNSECCMHLFLTMTKKTTSTILDGNHAFPPFYACYLLRSRATVTSNRTYVSVDAAGLMHNRSDLRPTRQSGFGSTMASLLKAP
jgi:hypothetical protein